MIKLVAFDWNGTLLADTEATVRSDNFALKKMGFKTITVKEYQETFDIPIMKYWHNLGYDDKFLKKNFEQLEKYYYQCYEKLENKCRARKGAKQSIVWLDDKKIKAVIYSNHAEQHIHKQLLRLKMDKLIKKIIARDINDKSHHFKRGKEQKLQSFVKQSKFKPNEVVSVGDTEEEVQIPKKLGYYSVALSGGWNTIKRLQKHKPDFLINNLKDLIPIIKQLNKND